MPLLPLLVQLVTFSVLRGGVNPQTTYLLAFFNLHNFFVLYVLHVIFGVKR